MVVIEIKKIQQNICQTLFNFFVDIPKISNMADIWGKNIEQWKVQS